MSLGVDVFGAGDLGFPRVSGDEPLFTGGVRGGVRFSPRERG